MKILIVAYACEPGKGSEPGIGWDWSMALAGNPNLEITVLTRANNRDPIEAALARDPVRPHPRFTYHDLPRWCRALKNLTNSVYPYYVLWCLLARRRAADLARQGEIDVVHHLTFSTDWLPGCTPKLAGCATVVGPLGGYRTSAALSRLVPLRYALIDALRRAVRGCGLHLRTRELRRCDLIIANNEEFAATYRALAPACPIEILSTQLCSTAASEQRQPPAPSGRERPMRILLAGRLLYWKGLDAALEALALLQQRHVPFDAVVVGSGPSSYVSHLKAKTERLGIGRALSFVPHMPRADFLQLMSATDVFLYPSLYGTADSIMIESLECGVPIVCFPSAGAYELLGEDYPYIAPEFTAQALAGTIQRAEKASAAYQECRGRLLARHAPERKLRQLEQAYRGACRQAQPRGRGALQNA